MILLPRILAVSLLLASFATISQAQRYPRGNGGGGAQYLGQANVDGGADHDNISVEGRRPYRALQLRVQNGTINFQRVVVHFDNGQDQLVPLRNRIPAGGSTRWINLPGDRRNVRSVEIWYSRGNWGVRRPKVELFGRG